jgi:hypothetical protein
MCILRRRGAGMDRAGDTEELSRGAYVGQAGFEPSATLTERKPPPSEAITPLARFLLNPQLHEHPPGRLTTWRWVGWLCLLLLVCAAVGTILHHPLAHAFGWKTPPGAFLKYVSTHPSPAAALALLFAPILEEIAFRAFLSTDPKSIFVGLAFFVVYACGLVRVNFVHMTGQFEIAHYYSGLWELAPAGVASLLLYRYAGQPILRFFRRHGAWVFWISCVVFGAGHAADFVNGEIVWWALVLALPQFLAGIALAYVRIMFGLRWSMLTHWTLDWLLVSLAWSDVAVARDHAAKVVLGLVTLILVLFVLVYGVVALTRVARGSW